MADSSASEDEKPYRTVQQQQNHDKALAQANRDSSQANRSRSASRRARRQRIKQGIESGKYMKTASLEALEEADAAGELDQMQMFERIGPDSTSMEGPVTHARAMRGEIPAPGGEANVPYKQEKLGSLDKQDGLKLKLEANLDVEIELKASIRGDLTLCLFS